MNEWRYAPLRGMHRDNFTFTLPTFHPTSWNGLQRLQLNGTSKHIVGQHGDLPENKGEKIDDVNKIKIIPATAEADEKVVQ